MNMDIHQLDFLYSVSNPVRTIQSKVNYGAMYEVY